MLLLEDKRTINYQTFLDALKGNDSRAILLNQLRNCLFSVLEFDPNTGEPLLSDMTSFLDRVSEIIPLSKEELEERKSNKFDWLYKSLSYNGRSLLYLLGNPRNEIIRSHERMNIYQAREIDSAGIMEISRRPGRTVREKIAVKPTILAVKREQGADTLENRLLKKYLTRLINALEERQKCFTDLNYENEDSTLSRIYSIIRRWLKSDEADCIGKWQNLPPNNILLHDKNYKKIWREWQFLLDLDEMVLNDWKNIDRLLTVYIFWKTLSILQSNGSKIRQSPLSFDYNKFEICNIAFKNSNSVFVEADNYTLKLENNKITVVSTDGKEHLIEIHFNELIIGNKVIPESLVSLSDANKISQKLANSIDKISVPRTIPKGFEEKQKYTAIKFSEFPYSAVSVSSIDNFERHDFSIHLTRQFWTENTEPDWFNIENSLSPASYAEKAGSFNIENVSFEDIFFDSENQILSKEKQATAAYDFMNSIRTFYNTDKLFYLLPDYLEDFSLSTIRLTANTVFPSANPIPDSIGTVFAFHQSEIFKSLSLSDDDFVFVIEKSSDNKLFSITPLQAKTTFELSNQKILKLSDYPEIPSGIRWEHHPSIIKENYDPSKVMEYIQTSISETEGIEKAKKIAIISGQKSIENARLELPEKNWIFFNTPFEAAAGAAFCAHIQEKVKEIPMWSEHLPVLQMTYLKNGKRSGSNLTFGKTVLPIRGHKQRIDIPEKFILNKNVKTYHFRLSRGNTDTSNSLKYEACLSNTAFPLKKNTECRLEMYYVYGEEQPFELYFVPINSTEFIRAKVEWQKIDEDSFPVPNFPPVRTWSEFVNWSDSYKQNRPLIEWEETNFERINEISNFFKGNSSFKYSIRKTPYIRFSCDLNAPMRTIHDKFGEFYELPISYDSFAKIDKRKFSQLVIERGNPSILSFTAKNTPYIFHEKKYYLASKLSNHLSLDKDSTKILPFAFRFPTMQIWNNSISIFERNDATDDFKKTVDSTIKNIEHLINNPAVKYQTELWNEILLFGCIMHKDAESIVSPYLDLNEFDNLDFSLNWKQIECKLFQIAYFIGNAESQKQKDCFRWLLDLSCSNQLLINFKLQALSIVFWRGENLIKEFSVEQVNKVFELLLRAIHSEYEIYKDEDNISNRKLNPLRTYCELMCALIRCRSFGNEFKDLLSPFNETIKKSIKQIEEIYSWLSKIGKILYPKQIKFTSFDSESGDQFLDYLLSWLDGENSSEMPRIESATADNQDDEESIDNDED